MTLKTQMKRACVVYCMRDEDVFDVRWFFAPPSSRTQPHHTVQQIPPLRMGGRLAGKLMKKLSSLRTSMIDFSNHCALSHVQLRMYCLSIETNRNLNGYVEVMKFDDFKNTNETCLCSVLYARWGMFLMCVGFSHSTTPHSTTDTPLRMGGRLAGKIQRQFANFLASGKNYFHIISCLLINQAHISKGVRVESCTASLQGVLEICRPNGPCVRKP